ncbi:MAG: hypothetical protein QM756_44785 [Polyangiaceae bacterium]
MPGSSSRALVAVAVASVWWLAACTAEVEPIDVAAGCPTQPLRGPIAAVVSEAPERLIDDFERGDVQLARLEGRDGAWVVGADATSVVLTAESSTQCAARGLVAGHFAGRDFKDWGANWTAVLRQFEAGMARGYDGSMYGGVSFWAALGGVGGKGVTSLVTPVGLSTLDTAWNGGVCTRCMDFYRTEVTLSSRWQRYEIRFDDLAQSGVGEPLVPLRTDQLVGFILWPPKQGFDIWIDDVRFEP